MATLSRKIFGLREIYFAAVTDREVEVAVDRLIDMAGRVEPKVTRDLQEIAGRYGGNMKGLKYRFKSNDSIKRKIQDRVDSGRIVDYEDIFNVIKDVLRYTMAFYVDTYSAQVQKAVYALRELGYEIMEEESSWGRGPYSDIQYTLIEPSGGVIFELQFHTMRSHTLKENVHKLYEEFRDALTPKWRKQELYDLMTSMWEYVPMPEDIERFPNTKEFPRPARRGSRRSQTVYVPLITIDFGKGLQVERYVDPRLILTRRIDDAFNSPDLREAQELADDALEVYQEEFEALDAVRWQASVV